jgi:transcriptional regulator with XRE-family HTH domain
MSQRYFEKFGHLLKKTRTAAGISQTEVARALRYDQQFISNWERGIAAPPVRVLHKIAKLYEVRVESLYELLMEDSLRRTRLQLEEQIR